MSTIIDKNNIPTGYLRISITDKCNMNCVYCHNEGQGEPLGREMSASTFRYILTNAIPFGLNKVRLTGGEPLLHPECKLFLKIAKKDFGIETVGFNTNAIDRKKLVEIVKENLIDSLVIGLDYYDGRISKNSPSGVSSSKILETILICKNLGQDVSIACVYNNDFAGIIKLAEWCLRHDVTLKILQVTKDVKEDKLDEAFTSMMEGVISHYSLEKVGLPKVGDFYGALNKVPRIFFFHSHCRMRECELCAAIHMRVTADGYIKTCIQEDLKFPLTEGNFQENLNKAIANIGKPPETRVSS